MVMSKRYIFDAILEVMEEREITDLATATLSKDLVSAVSEISDKEVSSIRIGKHLSILYGQEIVDRVRMKNESHTHKWWLKARK